MGIVGVASVLATLTADLVRRLGARRAFVASTVAEAIALAILAVAPSSLLAAIASAILFGTAYNATVSIQAIWGTHLFAEQPSRGISAAMSANGLGLLLGPLAAGLLAGQFGLGPVLLAGAVIVATAALFAPRTPILPQPVSGAVASFDEHEASHHWRHRGARTSVPAAGGGGGARAARGAHRTQRRLQRVPRR
ncbi:MAG: MFS transporter [Solirubrobacteraceae bacterium]